MAKIAILEGYPRKRRSHKRRARRSSALVKQQKRMKSCALRWKRDPEGKYRSFMKKCLSSKR